MSDRRARAAELIQRLKLWLRGRRPPYDPRTAYDQWAVSYRQEDNLLQTIERRLTEQALPIDLRGADVLDLGCGTGRWCQVLAQRGCRWIVGSDLSVGMLVHHRSPAVLVGGDACRIPFQERRFDLVLSCLALSYVERLDDVVAEMARVCADDGSVVVSDFHAAAARAGWKRNFPARRRAAGPVVGGVIESYPHTRPEYERALTRHGFTIDCYREESWEGVPAVFALRAHRV